MVSALMVMTFCHLHSAVVGVPEFSEFVHCAWLRLVQGFDEVFLGSSAVPVNSCLFYSEGLKYFASRDGMDIKGLGDSLAEKLINANKVRTITDIYRLKASDLLQLEKVKEKTANNIMAGIEASKKRPVVNVITALGIPDVGKSMAQLFVNHFGSIDAMSGASESEIASIEGVGDVIAHSVCEFFRENKSLIKELKELGLNTEQLSAPVSGGAFSGKTFVFTGTLTSMSRDEASHKAQ